MSVQWASKQHQRIKAFKPEVTSSEVVDKILWRIPATIRIPVRNRMGVEGKWTAFILAFEEISKGIHQPKKPIPFKPTLVRNNDPQKQSSSTKVQAPTSVRRTARACNTCGSTDPTHVWKTCKGN